MSPAQRHSFTGSERGIGEYKILMLFGHFILCLSHVYAQLLLMMIGDLLKGAEPAICSIVQMNKL